MFGIKLQRRTSLIILAAAVLILTFMAIFNRKNRDIVKFVAPTTNVMVTNQWYSSAFFEPWPETFFAYPLAVKVQSSSILISYPKVVSTPKTIFSQFENDIDIVPNKPFEKQTPVSTGDMHIELELKNDSQILRTVVAHGLPTVWIKYISGDKNLNISSSNSKTDLLNAHLVRVLVNGKSYLVKTDEKSFLSVGKSKIEVQFGINGFLSVTDEPEGVELDPRNIAGPLISSVFSYSNLKLSYFFSDSEKTVIALLPHQWNSYDKNQFIGSYNTLRGEMRAIYSNEIELNFPQAKILKMADMVAGLSDQEKLELQKRIVSDFLVIDSNPEPAGVYDGAKWIFKLAQIAEIAKAVNYPQTKNISDRLSKSLKSWLGSNSGKWQVSDNPRGVIAVTPQFGNEEFNDHNFHYGYFLAAAGIGIELDPSVKLSIEPGIKLLLSDIANTERNSDYPFLRGFDSYEGHSWASGKAIFADGNNQESTSEAVNRWYGIYRIGLALKDQNLIDLGKIGISMEEESAKTYWLMQNPNLYKTPEGYTSEIVSILWGGKADFATWFSPLSTHIYGIQFLPMTPAMSYIKGIYSNYVVDNADNAWNDIHDMVKVMNGVLVPDSQPKHEAGNSSTFYYLWIKYWQKGH